MIVKAARAGVKPAGLLHYLYGPGKATEHVNPRTIAAWDGLPALHSPAVAPRGGPSVKAMADALDAPVLNAEGRVPGDYVKHIVVANHAEDPTLTDALWASIAADVMKRAGLSAGPNDPAGVRWLAVRHDDSSIHIVYTAAREDGSTKVYFNYAKAWDQLRTSYEDRLGLTPTGRADGTAKRAFGQVEHARARQEQAAGDLRARPDSVELRHLCRVISAEVGEESSYVDRLRQAGVSVAVITAPDGTMADYQVGIDHGDGVPVMHWAAKIEREISVAALRARWRPADPKHPAEPADRDPAGTVVRVATTADLHELDEEEFAEVAAATGELLHTAAAATADPGLLRAAESYASAARLPRWEPERLALGQTAASQFARDLRRASATFASLARLGSNDCDVARLVMALAALLAQMQERHERGQRRGQAAAVIATQRELVEARAARTATPGPRPGRARPDRAPALGTDTRPRPDQPRQPGRDR